MTSLAKPTYFLAHARKSAGLKVRGGWGLASSILRPTTMLAPNAFGAGRVDIQR